MQADGRPDVDGDGVHVVLLRLVETSYLDVLGVDLVRSGDPGAGELCGGAAVGDRQAESFGRCFAAQVAAQVAEQARVPGAHRADHRDPRCGGVPGTRWIDEYGAGFTHRGEDRAGALVDEQACGRGGLVEVVHRRTGQLAELFAVGLEQVGRRIRQGVTQGEQGCAGRVHGDPRPASLPPGVEL